MTDWGTFSLATKWAQDAHRDQVDKAGVSVLLHAMRVAAGFNDPTLATVAILHDVVEDGGARAPTYAHLRAWFGREIADAVKAITRLEDETYADYITRCCQNVIALQVKRADVFDHLSRIGAIPDDMERASLLPRYEAAWAYIEPLWRKTLEHG